MVFYFLYQYIYRKTDSSGPQNIVDIVSSAKAYEMIAELQLNEEQLRENGYPRPGKKPGQAEIFKVQSATPNNENDRYCRRCGKIYKLDHYDDICVDQCIYHAKSPGFRRGNGILLKLNAKIIFKSSYS